MSQCQMCGRKIPDGQQLCPTCRNAVEWRQRQQQAQSGPGSQEGPRPVQSGPAGPKKPAARPPKGGARPQAAARLAERGRMAAIVLGIVLVLFLAFFAAALLLGGRASSGGQGTATLTAWEGSEAPAAVDAGPEQVTVSAPEQALPQAPEQSDTPQNPDQATDALSGEYIFPDSDSTYLTEEQVAALTPEQLRLARNEIYARHGRIFQDETLAAYFGSKSWYQPLYDAESFDALGDSILNEYEIANRDLIQSYEALYSGQ